MRDECAHIVRNAVTKIAALSLSAQHSIRTGKVGEAQASLDGIMHSVKQLDAVFKYCVGEQPCCSPNSECCGASKNDKGSKKQKSS